MRKLSISVLLCLIGFLFFTSSWAIDSEQLLPPDAAFKLSAKRETANKLLLTWDIADGYYLYRLKFRFASLNPDIKIGDPIFPAGQTKHDKYFGTVEIYRDSLDVELPVQRQTDKPTILDLEVTFLGCADAGVCYMPIQKVISLPLPEAGISGRQR